MPCSAWVCFTQKEGDTQVLAGKLQLTKQWNPYFGPHEPQKPARWKGLSVTPI
jgi:hypothetical protein